MLNASDIEFMQSSQDEIYTLRERSIIVIYTEVIRDDITGQIIGREDVEREVNAVITEMSIRGRDGSRYIENGIEYEQGDLKIDIKLEYIDGIVDKIVQAIFDGKEYEILGGDKKGIGTRNRVEFIGREIA